MAGKIIGRLTGAIALSVVFLLLAATQVRAGHYTATWTNGGGTEQWSDDSNWDIGQSPLNKADTFDVIIPDGFTVYYDVDEPGFVTDLELGATSTLVIDPGHSLTLLDDVSLAGTALSDGNSTSLICTSAGTTLGNGAKLSVANGATISCNAASYSSTTLNNNATLFSVDGYDARLNLSAMQSLDAGFTATYRTHTISATNYGVIDMSWLGTIYGPTHNTSALKFNIASNGFVNLYYLTDIMGGYTKFDIDVPSYSLPSLRTARDATFDIAGTTELILPSLESVNNCNFIIPDNGAIIAPALTSFNYSSMNLSPDIDFITGTLSNIDNSRFSLSGGIEFGVAGGNIDVGSYSSVGAGGGNYTLFSAVGTGTVFDLSSLTSIDAGFANTYRTHTISATDNGVINLSAVETIRSSAHSTSSLKFFTDSNGQIDLALLQELPYGYTNFDINTISFDLPELQTATGTTFDASGLTTISLPNLTTLTNSNIVIEDGGSVNAPALTDFTNSRVSLSPTRTFVNGTLNNIDNSRFSLSGGIEFGVAGGDIDTGSYSSVGVGGTNYTLFSAEGTGTVFDLSSLTSIDAGFPNTYRTHTISATDNSVIDLSAVETIRGSGHSTSSLKFYADSNGQIDLASLQEIPYGYTNFDINTISFNLPELQTATGTTFDASGLTTILLPNLISLANGNIVIEDGGAIIAPALTGLTNTQINLNPSRTFTTGAISNIDNSRFYLSSGMQFGVAYGNINANSYSSVASGAGNYTLISAAGVGTILDLSSLTSFNANFTNGYRTHTISLTDNAVLDLSGLGILAGPTHSTSRLSITVDSGSRLHFGSDIDISGYTDLNINGTSSEIIVDGGLTLNSNVAINAGEGALLGLSGDFIFNTTNEAACMADAAAIRFATEDGAVMEVAGEDLGIGGAGGGNFGVGRLIVGDDLIATTVTLVDLIDNGNRNGGREALYLYGTGGQSGLRIKPDSKFIIGDINVYAYVGAEMVHINSLFGPGVKWIAFDEGVITLTDYECTLQADLNGDCFVDLSDLAVMASEWLQCGDLDCP